MTVDFMRLGQYDLKNLTITTPSKSIDLKKLAASCDIYESVLSPGVIVALNIYDATGLFDKINFVEEKLNVSFSTNPDGKSIEYDFRIIECNHANEINQGKGITFKLLGVTEESFNSRLVKDFQLVRQKIEASVVVDMILDKVIKSTKPRFFEKTSGLHTFVKTNINPMEAIDGIRNVAVSGKYQGSAFVFFENIKGLHFKTLEKLISDGKKNIGDKIFWSMPTAMVSTTETSNWRNILAHKIIQNGNQNVLLATGGAKVRVQGFDIKGMKIVQEVIKKSSDFDFIKLNPGTEVTSLKRAQKITEDPGRVIQLLINPDQESNQLVDKVAAEACYLSEFLSVITHVTIYGDSEITAGDVITCHFKERTGLTQEGKDSYKDDDPITSGNYLVTKCRHSLSFGESPEYYQALEIVKDGIYSQPEPVRLV